MPIELVENKGLKPGQCHAEGCDNTARKSITKVWLNKKENVIKIREKAGKKTKRCKMLFCRHHRHLGNEMPRKVRWGITSSQTVRIVKK